MNADGRSAGNGGYLPGPLAAGLEAPNCAVKNDDVSDTRGVAVAVAIDMLKLSLFLDLSNKVFIKGNLEFGRQLDFVRLDHLDLDRRGLDLGGLVFRGLGSALLAVGRSAGGRGSHVWFSRNGCLCALRQELFLDHIGSADWHREDSAVQSPVSIAIPNGERVDLLAEQTQEAAAAVGRSHTYRPNCLADSLFSVGAGDNILNGRGAYVGGCFGVDKMQISAFNVQRSLCILFHAREADKLNRFNGSREVLRVPAGTHQPGKQQSNKNRHASEYHVCLLDHEVQSVSTKVHQHERNVIGRRALPPGGDAIENTLFHLLGRQGRCLADDFLDNLLRLRAKRPPNCRGQQGLCARP